MRSWWSGSMIAALQKHFGMGAAETAESNAQEGIKKRERWDSQRGPIQHIPMLDAIEGPVKQYSASLGYFKFVAGSHSTGYLSPPHNAF
jgi:hypothetical protein